MQERKKDRLTVALAVIYGILVVWLILFKMATPSEFAEMRHERALNLIPFHYDEETSNHLSEVLDNVLVFIPLGIYLRMLGRRGGTAILLCAGFSLALEILQYIFGIGAADITDLITNTFGAAVGVGVYWLMEKLFKKQETRHRVLRAAALVCTALLIALMAVLLLSN